METTELSTDKSSDQSLRKKGHFPSITAAEEFNGILKELIGTDKLVKD